MIESQNHLILKKSLTHHEEVPLLTIILAYNIVTYNKKMDLMKFDVQGHKTDITKTTFCKLLRLRTSDGYSNHDLFSSSSIIKVYHQIGYKSDLFVLLKFHKSYFPPIWNDLFTILFKGFSQRITSSDNANKLFHTLLYTLYTNEKIDLCQILQVQFTQIPASSMNDSNTSCAYFWSIVLKNAWDHFKVPRVADMQFVKFSMLNKTTFVTTDAKNFHYIRDILM